MKSQPTSLRSRLTTVYSVVIVLILLGFAGLVYSVVVYLQARFDRDRLDTGYELIEEVLVNSGGDVYDVMNLSGDRLFRVQYIGEHPAALPDVYETAGYQAATFTFLEGGDEPWLGYRRFSRHGRHFLVRRGLVPGYGIAIEYVIEVTGSSAGAHYLLLVLAGSLLIGSILAWLIARGFARQAVSPVQGITDQARRISADSLSERLPVTNPRDEAGQLANEFNAVLDRLEKSFNQLRRFSADVSHELRTPLASIRSTGEVVLRDAPSPTRCSEALEEILEEVDYMSRILDVLLLLSRGESGKLTVNPVMVDLVEVTEASVADLRILAEEKHQELAISAVDKVSVTADATLLRQALNNVIHNAIRYAPDAGRIMVEVALTDDSSCCIRIMDSGPGIPVNEREAVFDRFYRLDKSRTRTLGGAGLGLSIARWAIDANGGSIAFIDREGWGCCCEITLPVSSS